MVYHNSTKASRDSALAASALRDEAACFRTAEIQDGKAAAGEAMQPGGRVAAGSVHR
ncbi:hypothetical protein [Sphingopyxis sp. R3-92]|uniref:hypothetical protein n=1 Tax=Sphingopyxis sp. R3-92 TaxID=3158553 RepID=UPI003EE434E6